MKTANWLRVLILVIGLGLEATRQVAAQSEVGTQTPIQVSFCELVRNPSAYSGKLILTTVRITATKHGSSLWDPRCRSLSLAWQTDPLYKSTAGLVALDREMSAHGLSDHPIVANLKGKFMHDQYSALLKRRMSFLIVQAATDIRQTKDEEHR